jgi:hypothetical protein
MTMIAQVVALPRVAEPPHYTTFMEHRVSTAAPKKSNVAETG